MLDALTLDQLRIFVAVVDEGSFSAAARRVQRVQSAVSHAMANLEAELGLTLWDRQTRVPTLTAEGRVVLQGVRKVLADVDALRRTVQSLSGGLEPALALAVDQLFPTQALVHVCREFARAFPAIPLRVHSETLSNVVDRVLDGTCQLGVAVDAVEAPTLTRHHVTAVRLVPTVAREHPLAGHRGRVPLEVLREHTQIVLSERGEGPIQLRLSQGGRLPDQGVLSVLTWRVADLTTKLALIRAGLGWGTLPLHLVREDLAKKRLVRVRPEAWDERGPVASLAVVHRPELALGPASRWLLAQLVDACRAEIRGAPAARPRLRRAGRAR